MSNNQMRADMMNGAGGPQGAFQKGKPQIDKEKVKSYVQNQVIQPDPTDHLLWQLITMVPRVAMPVAIIVFIVNIILPGIGTIIAACANKNDEPTSKAQLAIGKLQFLTSFFLVGWAWSIYWAYLILKEA